LIQSIKQWHNFSNGAQEESININEDLES